MSLDDAIINHYTTKKLEAETFLSRYILDAQNTFVTGGFFARLFHNLPFKDIDVFVRNSVNFDSVKQLYMNDARFRLIESRARFCKFAIVGFDFTLDLVGFTNRATSNDLISRFDFTITRFKYENGSLTAFETSDIMHLFLKQLRYTNNILFTTSRNNTLTRAERYRQLGFSIEDDFFEKVSSDLLRMTRRRRTTYATAMGPISLPTNPSTDEAVELENNGAVLTDEANSLELSFNVDVGWSSMPETHLSEDIRNAEEDDMTAYVESRQQRPPLQIETQNIPESSPSFDGSMESIERLIV